MLNSPQKIIVINIEKELPLKIVSMIQPPFCDNAKKVKKGKIPNPESEYPKNQTSQLSRLSCDLSKLLEHAFLTFFPVFLVLQEFSIEKFQQISVKH